MTSRENCRRAIEFTGHGARTVSYPIEGCYVSLAAERLKERGGRYVQSAVWFTLFERLWMHLCGNVTAILPDLIEIGLNVLNPVQPQAMDVRQLSREFGGTVCFNGGYIGGTSHFVMPETPLDKSSPCSRRSWSTRLPGRQLYGASDSMLSLQTVLAR